jgi:hypothetical protein
MRRPQRCVVFIDKRLKDALDMCLDRGAIGRTIVLAKDRKGQSAKGEEKKGETSELASHSIDLRIRFDVSYYEYYGERFCQMARKRRFYNSMLGQWVPDASHKRISQR